LRDGYVPQALIALLLGGFAALLGGMSSASSSDDDDDDGSAAPGGPDPDGDGSDTGDSGGSSAVPDGPVPDGAPAPELSGDTQGLAWDGPSAEEQLIVELINRARMDPAAEVARLDEPLASGISPSPAEPLAVTSELGAASRAHSQDMDDRDFFRHTNLDGQSPGDRALEEGHGTRFVGENIGWIGSGSLPSDTQPRTEAHHQHLWDSDGHQRNLMDDRWSEIGVGYDEGSYDGWNGSTFVTQMFSDRGFSYLTGVVIEDGDGDDFYDIGEGLGGVQITARDGTDSFATETWASGGYSLALPRGTYEVLFEGGGLDAPLTRTVTIRDENVKLDVVEDRGVVTLASHAPEPAPEAGAVLDFLPVVPMEDLPDDEDDAETDLLLA